RSKWQREDYRKRTIDKALAGRTEFYDWHRGNGDAPFRPGKGASPSKPRRMARAIDPYQPFPVEALPNPVRQYVAHSAHTLACTPAYDASPALAVCASSIGNSRVIQLKRGWQEPSVIWAVIVGDSGTLKSPAYLKAVGHLFAVQRQRIAEHRKA